MKLLVLSAVLKQRHIDKIKAEFPEMQDYNLIALFPIGYIEEGSVPSKSHTEFRSDEEMISVY